MGKHQPAISRRGFVAASGAVALGAGLGATATGCSSGGDAAKGGDAQKEDKWVPTTCNMCFNQCSILAHVVDGKVVELKGNPDSPVGRGHICAKGASGIMQLYDPNRITKPMKRTNPKKALTKILAGKRSAGMRPTNSSTKISARPLNAVAPMPLRACRWLQARQEASFGTRPLVLSTATQREAARTFAALRASA
mgnify:CR=1 FL=1